MIAGGTIGLLIAVIYTLATGKLKLSKDRAAYGLPARAAALLGLVPLMLVFSLAVPAGGIARMPNGVMIFLGALVAAIGIIYIVAWPFGEAPRQ